VTLEEVLAKLPEDATIPASIVRRYLAELHAAHDAEIDSLFRAFELVTAEQPAGARLN
jgi:hypothetical protein